MESVQDPYLHGGWEQRGQIRCFFFHGEGRSKFSYAWRMYKLCQADNTSNCTERKTGVIYGSRGVFQGLYPLKSNGCYFWSSNFQYDSYNPPKGSN